MRAFPVVGNPPAAAHDGVRAPETESETVISVAALMPEPVAVSARVNVSVWAATALVSNHPVEKDPVELVVSMVTERPVEAVEILPARSVCVTVIVWVPSARAEVVQE